MPSASSPPVDISVLTTVTNRVHAIEYLREFLFDEDVVFRLKLKSRGSNAKDWVDKNEGLIPVDETLRGFLPCQKDDKGDLMDPVPILRKHRTLAALCRAFTEADETGFKLQSLRLTFDVEANRKLAGTNMFARHFFLHMYEMKTCHIIHHKNADDDVQSTVEAFFEGHVIYDLVESYLKMVGDTELCETEKFLFSLSTKMCEEPIFYPHEPPQTGNFLPVSLYSISSEDAEAGAYFCSFLRLHEDLGNHPKVIKSYWDLGYFSLLEFGSEAEGDEKEEDVKEKEGEKGENKRGGKEEVDKILPSAIEPSEGIISEDDLFDEHPIKIPKKSNKLKKTRKTIQITLDDQLSEEDSIEEVGGDEEERVETGGHTGFTDSEEDEDVFAGNGRYTKAELKEDEEIMGEGGELTKEGYLKDGFLVSDDSPTGSGDDDDEDAFLSRVVRRAKRRKTSRLSPSHTHPKKQMTFDEDEEEEQASVIAKENEEDDEEFFLQDVRSFLCDWNYITQLPGMTFEILHKSFCTHVLRLKSHRHFRSLKKSDYHAWELMERINRITKSFSETMKKFADTRDDVMQYTKGVESDEETDEMMGNLPNSRKRGRDGRKK